MRRQSASRSKGCCRRSNATTTEHCDPSRARTRDILVCCSHRRDKTVLCSCVVIAPFQMGLAGKHRHRPLHRSTIRPLTLLRIWMARSPDGLSGRRERPDGSMRSGCLGRRWIQENIKPRAREKEDEALDSRVANALNRAGTVFQALDADHGRSNLCSWPRADKGRGPPPPNRDALRLQGNRRDVWPRDRRRPCRQP